jgi:hypothetical protein
MAIPSAAFTGDSHANVAVQQFACGLNGHLPLWTSQLVTASPYRAHF